METWWIFYGVIFAENDWFIGEDGRGGLKFYPESRGGGEARTNSRWQFHREWRDEVAEDCQWCYRTWRVFSCVWEAWRFAFVHNRKCSLGWALHWHFCRDWYREVEDFHARYRYFRKDFQCPRDYLIRWWIKRRCLFGEDCCDDICDWRERRWPRHRCNNDADDFSGVFFEAAVTLREFDHLWECDVSPILHPPFFRPLSFFFHSWKFCFSPEALIRNCPMAILLFRSPGSHRRPIFALRCPRSNNRRCRSPEFHCRPRCYDDDECDVDSALVSFSLNLSSPNFHSL